MPIYEYVCHTCGKSFEEMQKFSDPVLQECICGEAGQVERKVSKSAFHLKGGGWYKDGYGNSNSSSETASSESKNTGTDSSSKDTSSSSKDTPSSSKDTSSSNSSSSPSAPASSAA